MASPITPLLEVLRACSVDEQYEFARLAGTTRNYLYQLATCHRKNPNVGLASSICAASKTLHEQTGGRVRVLTTGDLASMCAIAQHVC